MSQAALDQISASLTRAEKLLGELETRHESKKEKVSARAARDEAREVFAGGGEAVSIESTTTGESLDGDKSSVGLKLGSGAATLSMSETDVHAVDASGKSIETPDLEGAGRLEGEDQAFIDEHGNYKVSSTTSVGIDGSRGELSLGRSNTTTRVDFEGDDPDATAKENEEKRAERTRTRTNKESVSVSAGPDGASMNMEFEESDSKTGTSDSTSMGMGVDSEGNVTTRVGETHVEKNDMGGKDTTSTSGSVNLSTGEVSANRSSSSVDKDGDGGRVDVGGGVNAKEGKANISLGATGLEADPDKPGESRDAVSVRASGAIDTHLDDGRGAGVSGEVSQDIKGFTLSIGGGYDFVVYNPELDKETGIVTVKASVQSSVKGGAGLTPGGTGISASISQAEGKELVKKFTSMKEAQVWFDQPREKIMKEMTGFDGALGEGESRSTSESEEMTVGGKAKVKAVDIGYEESSKTELEYKETGGKDGQITITVTVKESGSTSASAAGSVGAVDASIGQTEASSQGRSYDFVLNQNAEDYEALRKELRNAGTVERIEALRDDPRFKNHVGKETISSSEESSTDFQTGAGKGALSVGTQQRSKKESSVTRDQETLSAEFSGSEGTALKGSLVGVKAGVDVEEGAHASLESDGEREVDLHRQVKMEGLLGWISSYKKKLSGYKIDEKHFVKVEARAADAKKWSGCNIYPRRDALEAWKTLRERILQPRTDWEWFDSDWVDLDFDMLRKLLQMAEVADFMSKWASKGGYEGWENMLRNWGQNRNLYASRSNAEDLGSEYEWKDELDKQRKVYDGLEAQIEKLPGMVDKAMMNGKEPEMEKHCEALIRNIDTLRKSLSAFEDYDSKRALIEMLQALDNMENEVHLQKGRCIDGGQSTEDSYQEQLLREIDQILARCKRAKQAEEQLLKKMRDEFSDEIIPESEGLIDVGMAMFKSAGAALSQDKSWEYKTPMVELYDKWVKDIRACRKLYEQTSLPTNDWEISAGSDFPRNADLEPNTREFIRLVKKSQDQMTFYASVSDGTPPEKTYSHFLSY
jgi:hypothetical protein